MAAAGGFKGFLLEKGEKVALITGGVLGLLLVGWGILNLFSIEESKTSEALAKSMNQSIEQIKGKLNQKVDPLPEPTGTISQPLTVATVARGEPLPVLFDPHKMPDNRRFNPEVAKVVEGQIDVVYLKIRANDIVLEFDKDRTTVKKVRLGVLTTRKEELKSDLGKYASDLVGKVKNPTPPSVLGNAGFGYLGGMGMGGGPLMPPNFGNKGGFPMGLMGGPMLPPTGNIGPPMGLMGGPMLPPGPIPGGNRGALGVPPGPGIGDSGMAGGPSMYDNGSTAFTLGAGLERRDVQYVEASADDEATLEKEINGRPLADTIRPERMAIIQASFPYKEQLEKIRIALRLKSIEEVLQNPDTVPVFAGFEVQRRIIDRFGRPVLPSGSKDEWNPLPYLLNGHELNMVKLWPNPEEKDHQWVMLDPTNRLTVTLPYPIAGKYPSLRLQTLLNTIDKRKAANKTPVPPPVPSRFKFEDKEGLFGGGFSRPAGRNEFFGAGGNAPPPSAYNPFGKKDNDMGAGATNPVLDYPEYVLLRFHDNTIEEGFEYEYRVRVLMRNPNYEKKELVSVEDDAKVPILPANPYEGWTQIPGRASIKREKTFYAVDALQTYDKKNPTKPVGPNEVGLQFHQWVLRLKTSPRTQEPVGDWVLTELKATKGTFVGGAVVTPLPLWDSSISDFSLKPIPGEPIPKGKDPKDAPRGVKFDPLPQRLFVLDIRGGKTTERVTVPGRGTKDVSDDSAIEVVLISPDGTDIQIRSTAMDKPNPDRKAREEKWLSWIDEVKAKSESQPGKDPKPKNDF